MSTSTSRCSNPPIVQVMQPLGRADVDDDGDEDILAQNLHKSRRFEGASGGIRKQSQSGLPGSGGVTPTLGADGPFRVGQPVEISLTGATGGIVGWFHRTDVADTPPIFRSGYQLATRQAYVQPMQFVTSGTPAAVGEGAWSIHFNVPEYIAGGTKLYFIDLSDPGTPSGRARTNDLRIKYGS